MAATAEEPIIKTPEDWVLLKNTTDEVVNFTHDGHPNQIKAKGDLIVPRAIADHARKKTYSMAKVEEAAKKGETVSGHVLEIVELPSEQRTQGKYPQFGRSYDEAKKTVEQLTARCKAFEKEVAELTAEKSDLLRDNEKLSKELADLKKKK